MIDTNVLTDAASFLQMKRSHFQFKNTVSFASVEDMQAHILACGGNFRLASDYSRPVSDVIAGNCIVLETRFPASSIPHFYARFVGASGNVEVIRHSIEHGKTAEEAVAWLSSEYFARNKLDILTENDLPLHEYPEDEVLHAVDGDHMNPIYLKHLRFYEAYNQWLAAQAGS